jgi:hypothetical protein
VPPFLVRGLMPLVAILQAPWVRRSDRRIMILRRNHQRIGVVAASGSDTFVDLESRRLPFQSPLAPPCKKERPKTATACQVLVALPCHVVPRILTFVLFAPRILILRIAQACDGFSYMAPGNSTGADNSLTSGCPSLSSASYHSQLPR